MFLFGDFNNWNRFEHKMEKDEFGVWSVFLPNKEDGSPPIAHASKLKALVVSYDGMHRERNPAWYDSG